MDRGRRSASPGGTNDTLLPSTHHVVPASPSGNPTEAFANSVARVTFHSATQGFLRFDAFLDLAINRLVAIA